MSVDKHLINTQDTIKYTSRINLHAKGITIVLAHSNFFLFSVLETHGYTIYRDSSFGEKREICLWISCKHHHAQPRRPI